MDLFVRIYIVDVNFLNTLKIVKLNTSQILLTYTNVILSPKILFFFIGMINLIVFSRMK